MVRVGIIGVGGIAQGVHIKGLKACEDVKITAICDIKEETLKKVGDMLELDEAHRFIDYHDLINCGEVDAIEICTSNDVHVEIAKAVLEKGIPVNVEKPLSVDLKTANTIVDVMENRKVPAMMTFSYRFFSAVRYAKHIIEEGVLGDIINVDVSYSKDSAFWPGRRLDWRFDKNIAGTGALGDLGVHLIDMTHFLVGDIKSVCGHKAVIVKERKKLDSEEIGQVTTDDFCSFIAKLDNGAFANFLITRCAWGNANTIKYDIYGTKGVISFNLNDPEVISVCTNQLDSSKKNSPEFGLKEIAVPEEFKASQERVFIDSVLGKYDSCYPHLEEGIKCQKVLEAIEISSNTNTWVDTNN